jgi:hypothetical protein
MASRSRVGDALGGHIAFQRSLPVMFRRAHRPAPDSNFWITTATSLALVLDHDGDIARACFRVLIASRMGNADGIE